MPTQDYFVSNHPTINSSNISILDIVLLLCKFGWNWLQSKVLLHMHFRILSKKQQKKLTKIGSWEKNWHVINGTASKKPQNKGSMKRSISISHSCHLFSSANFKYGDYETILKCFVEKKNPLIAASPRFHQNMT